MRTLVAAASLLLLCAPAWAQIDDTLLAPGWTADGAYFTFGNYSAGAADLSVVDAQTGIADTLAGCWDENQKLCDDLLKGRAKAFPPSRTSPDGKAKAEVVNVLKKGAGHWDGGHWVRDASFVSELRVVRDGVSKVSASSNGSAEKITPYWSPDGRRIAWLVDNGSHPCGMASCTDISAIIGSTGGANVQILAENKILSKVARPAAAAVAKAGLTPAFVGKALKARDRSVVYFGDGFKEHADKIAAALPGGATVEKLSWKTPADLVVAVGSSAVAAPKKK
jgi:hypothetical protein